MWLTRLTGFAANCNLFVSYLGYFWPAVGASELRAGVIVTFVAGLTIVNLIGVRETAIASDIFTVGKLAALIFFIVAGLAFSACVAAAARRCDSSEYSSSSSRERFHSSAIASAASSL